MIAGSGVWWSGAEQALREFVERTQIPLYTITMARGTVPDDHPLCMGYADPALNYAVHTVFREADLFLVAGKRIDYRLALGGTRLFPAEAKFIQIDIHPQELGMNRALDAAVCGDARAALDAIPDAGAVRTEWLERVRELRAASAARLETADADAAVFFRALREALPKDVLFSWDGGDFAHWGRALLPARHAGGWLRLGPLGTIGSSLPNAIALQLAHPGRKVVAITGDGALGFYLAEMDTAARFNLPIVLIVGNDAGWGLERELQSWGTGGAPTVACELQSARYDLVMKAFGGDGETIERPEEVRPAIERALAFARSVLFERKDSRRAIAVHGVADCGEEALAIDGACRRRQTQAKHCFDLAEFLADACEGAIELPEDPQSRAVNREGDQHDDQLG